MSLQSTIDLSIVSTQTKIADLVTGSAPLNFLPGYVLNNGTGNQQADLVVSDNRTLTVGGTETLDLNGGLVDIYGAVAAFARVKVLAIKADRRNASNIRVGGGSWTSMFFGANDEILVRPGGLFLVACSEATGYVVTPATGDGLTITHGGVLETVIYDIVIIGASV